MIKMTHVVIAILLMTAEIRATEMKVIGKLISVPPSGRQDHIYEGTQTKFHVNISQDDISAEPVNCLIDRWGRFEYEFNASGGKLIFVLKTTPKDLDRYGHYEPYEDTIERLVAPEVRVVFRLMTSRAAMETKRVEAQAARALLGGNLTPDVIKPVIALFEAAEKYEENAETNRQMAQLFQDAGMYQNAIARWDKALNLAGDSVDYPLSQHFAERARRNLIQCLINEAYLQRSTPPPTDAEGNAAADSLSTCEEILARIVELDDNELRSLGDTIRGGWLDALALVYADGTQWHRFPDEVVQNPKLHAQWKRLYYISFKRRTAPEDIQVESVRRGLQELLRATGGGRPVPSW